MNYVLSFCKITAASKTFSRNFYLPLLKPLTPKDALRTFRITGKWLLGSKRQHYIPVLLNHTKKRSKRAKDYGKIKHKHMEDYLYMMPIIDPDNVESHQKICNILNGRKGKGAFVYTVNDKHYNLVVDAPLEFAIRDGDIIDVLMSQGTDRILLKLKDFKKIPVDIQNYIGNDRLYKGEGATTKEDERNHHHGKYTMKLAKMFEDMERKEEKWEVELNKILEKRKLRFGEATKEWNEMIRGATANMDWKKYEKQAKRIVQYIEEPIVEYYVGMEVGDLEKTKDVENLITRNGNNILSQLPTLQEIPELIKNMTNAVIHEYEVEVDPPEDSASKEKIKKIVSGIKTILPSGRECFLIGQMVKCEEGELFIPGQTVENEFGVEYNPGITIYKDNKATLINGLIVGDPDNKNPMFMPMESAITEAGFVSFATTQEERVKYKPRKVPVRKVIKSASQNPEDNYEEYYYDDEEFLEERIKPKRVRRVLKRRKIIPPGCVYNAEREDEYEEEEYSEYEEIDDDEEEHLNELLQEEEKAKASQLAVNEQQAEAEELTLEEIIERHKKAVDPRIRACREMIEEERKIFKAMDAKITELIEDIEVKTVEVKERLEELRNLTVVQEIDPVSTASIDDATEIATQITNHLQDANAISEILFTMVRRIVAFPDKNSINIENINNPNITNGNEIDERNRRREKLKIALKTAMVAANNVFKNRPKDEVSALKAIGTVLILALQDQDKLIAELCHLMNDPMDRNEICALLLKELSQKYKKTKLKALQSIVENEKELVQDDSKVVEKLKDILEKRGDVIGPAFKKIAKNNSDLLTRVIELIKNDVNDVKSERNATQTLQDAIVKAVKEIAEQDLNTFVSKAEENDLKDFIGEAVAFSHVLGLNGVAQDLLNLPLNAKIIPASDKTCLNLLKRLIIIRKLAESDRGQTAALKELKKHPEFGKTNPRIRQLIRESAGLISESVSINNSRQIPAKLLEEQNIVALEDFLIQKLRVTLPALVSKNGKQAVIPQELVDDVLEGRVPYVLVDEEGVRDMKAVKKFSNGIITNEKDFEKPLDDYSPFGTQDRKTGKKNEKWAEVPKFGKMDMREAPIPMSTPPEPPSHEPELPQQPVHEHSPPQEEEHLPILVCTYGVRMVYPIEARRDVLAGRVAYIYVDDTGATIFRPKHIFSALKLNNQQRRKYEDYPCIGAHQRIFEKRTTRRRRRRAVQETQGILWRLNYSGQYIN
ncbi:hypothetical protein ILUMI_05813 [Ignelater luminosus]|uniref:Uncharacterized protein n=1 Tax=Ignelater luminosus TaxID=2038154 RepID=A0A8K0GD81_IGNLU|nr:hypothetical protein ILUMI_05813 [Ignelater luminosus]